MSLFKSLRNSMFMGACSLVVLAGCTSKIQQKEMEKPPVTVDAAKFQKTIDGKTTDLYVIENEMLKLAITNYGGRVVNWLVPDKNGEYADISLGFSSVDGYIESGEPFYGALIGRNGNRIANGEFTLNGKTYHLAKNNGPNNLHGGPTGFHNRVWDAEQIDERTLKLSYLSEDGEEGFPGNLNVQVIYQLISENELQIEYTAVTDAPTIVNLTNHTFFNLKGEGNGTINDHELIINADQFTPVDETLIPLGDHAAVSGTPFDFTTAHTIGERVNDENEQLEFGGGYDHNYVLNKGGEYPLSFAASVYEPHSGRQMEIFTTEPGIQFYGGNFMNGNDVSVEGKTFDYRTAFCLEPQHHPDAPNQSSFPSTVLQPGELYHTISVYRFSTK